MTTTAEPTTTRCPYWCIPEETEHDAEHVDFYHRSVAVLMPDAEGGQAAVSLSGFSTLDTGYPDEMHVVVDDRRYTVAQARRLAREILAVCERAEAGR